MLQIGGAAVARARTAPESRRSSSTAYYPRLHSDGRETEETGEGEERVGLLINANI